MPKIGLTVTKDRTAEVARLLRTLGENQVLVGVPQSTAGRQDGGINNPSLAYLHDRGSPANNIPARPFLEPGVEAAAEGIAQVLARAASSALAGQQNAALRGLNQAGLIAQASIQRKIVDGPFVPLKPETVRRKGSSRPLIDTGQLRQAVTYVVRPKGG